MLTRLRYRRDGQTDGQTAFQLYIVDYCTMYFMYMVSLIASMLSLLKIQRPHLNLKVLYIYVHGTVQLKGNVAFAHITALSKWMHSIV